MLLQLSISVLQRFIGYWIPGLRDLRLRHTARGLRNVTIINISSCGQIAVRFQSGLRCGQVAVRLQLESNVKLLAYKPLWFLCGLKTI